MTSKTASSSKLSIAEFVSKLARESVIAGCALGSPYVLYKFDEMLAGLTGEQDMFRRVYQDVKKTGDNALFARLLVSHKLQFNTTTTVDGKTYNLNSLTPVQRLEVMDKLIKKYGEIKIAVSEPTLGYQCTFVASKELGKDAQPIPQLTVEQTNEFAEALGRQCKLDGEEIQKMKKNLSTIIKTASSSVGPYSSPLTTVAAKDIQYEIAVPKAVQLG